MVPYWANHRSYSFNHYRYRANYYRNDECAKHHYNLPCFTSLLDFIFLLQNREENKTYSA